MLPRVRVLEDCVNQNDFDELDFYNNKFMGFAQASVSNPDGSVATHKFLTTQGFGIYDTSQPALVCNTPAPCHNDPYSALGNAAHSHEYELDQYATDGKTLLSQVKTQWSATCPPTGVSGTPANPNWGNWDGALVTELDHSNPVMVCEVHPVQVDRYTYDGTGGQPVHSATAYTYDGVGRVATQAQVSNTGSGTVVADSSGHGNGATLSGGVTEQLPGLNGDGGTSMSFDGSAAAVTAPALTPLQGDNTRTVELWMSTSNPGHQTVFSSGTGAANQAFSLGPVPSSQVSSSLAPGTGLYIWLDGSDVYLPNSNLADGQRHHVVVTLSGTTLNAYVDGSAPAAMLLSSSGTWSSPSAQPVSLWATPNTASSAVGIPPQGYQGVVDAVAIYGAALTSSRVQSHFSAGSGYQAAVLADAPTAYYSMDDGAGGPGPNTIVTRPQYVQNDSVSATSSSATGRYLIDYPAFDDVEDPAGNRYRCSYTSYDGQGFTTGQTSGLTVGKVTTADRYTGCGTSPGFTTSGQIRTTSAFDVFGNLAATADPDANAGVAGHMGCTVGSTSYSSCTTYDSTFGSLPTSSSNALNQTMIVGHQAPGAGTVTDSSGNGNHGTTVGPVALGVPGAPITDGDTTAMGFNNQGYAAIADSPRWHSPAISVEAWVYKTADVAWQRVVGGGTFPNTNFQLIADNTGKLMFLVFTSTTSNVNVISPSSIPLNTWQHVVGSFDGTTIALYLNGVMVAQQAAAVTMQTGSGGVGIGADPNGGNPWNGRLDEVAIYNSAIPSSRVQAHFNATASYRSAVLADAPAGYYRLDDTTGPSSGFGLWPTSSIDVNGRTNSTAYDALGRVTAQTLPGESSGLSTQTTAYTIWCSGTAAQSPCVEVDKTQRLNSTTTATSRAFYDGLGRLVETRSPAPGGQDVIRYSVYDASQRLAFQSVPYLVGAYTGAPGAAAYSTPDTSQAGTTSTYDGLGRLLTSTDALSFKSSKSYSVACSPRGVSDSGCYEQTLSVDANGHQSGTLVDGLGRTAYEQRYTGNSTYALYATAKYTYDFVGNLVKIVQPDGATQTTFGYDMAGRKTSMTDPDLGGQTYTYDQNGNLVQSIDARGSAGTIFVGYDGLDRPIWRNTSNSQTGAYDTYSYDATAGGNVGIGRLTSETFAAGSLSGSYTYTYDGRGQQTAGALTVGASSFPLGSTYDDAGNVLTQTYPDGQTITNSYTAQGWLSQVATSQGSTTLASNLAYTGIGGAFGEVTAMHLGGGYDYSASYDPLNRATDLKTKRSSDSAVMFDQSRTFDGAGNVTTTNTTMPGATDNQSFCYDEQDRLTWASAATATPPCGGSNTAGTLTAAQYTQSFSYDVMGRLTSGPLGTYTYADPAHVHAATVIGTSWTGAYDAAGNMTCRAPSGSSTCAGTQTGAQLGYNNEGELASWQNAPSSPSTTAQFLYDGQGQRVEQSVTQSGSTTTTVYVGNAEEVSTTGGTTTTTAYYYASGKRIGLSVNGVVSYLASDGLGSATVTLNGTGSATAAQLFAPYGGVRYSSGTMPTSYGFTGQRSDAASGLDYYGARYYDPLAGQFTSADSVVPGGGFDLSGLSRYAYVAGNPENRTDPTGHINLMVGDDSGTAVPVENAFSGSYTWGVAPPVYHRAWTRPYRLTAPRRPAPSYRPRGGDPERCSAGCHGGSTQTSQTPTPARARLITLRASIVGGEADDPFLKKPAASNPYLSVATRCC
jgi:RHS repeat-associated protein